MKQKSEEQKQLELVGNSICNLLKKDDLWLYTTRKEKEMEIGVQVQGKNYTLTLREGLKGS